MKYDKLLELQTSASTHKRVMRHPESCLQRQIVRWFRLQYPQYLIAAIPNGGYRSAHEARIMKLEGVLAGFSDLIIITPRNILFVEVKTKDGRQSELQKVFQSNVQRLGYKYFICRSLDEFCAIVKKSIYKPNY